MNTKVNEVKYVEECLLSSEKPNDKYTIGLVILYYIKKEEKDIKNLVISYINEANKDNMNIEQVLSTEKWINYLKNNNINLTNEDYIGISRNEIIKISSLENKRKERLLFTALVQSKYNHLKFGNDYIIFDKKILFKEAKVNVSKKERDLILHEFLNLGIISIPKKVNTASIIVNICDEEEPTIKIDNLENNYCDIYQYFIENKNYGECNNCKKYIEKKKEQKYCVPCAKKIKNEQMRTIMREKRKNDKML